MYRFYSVLIVFAILSNARCYSQESSNIDVVMQKGHIQPLSSIAYHPSGNYFATGSLDNSIKIWDVNSGKIIRSINIHTGKVNNLQFSADGYQLLSTAMDNKVVVTETNSGKTIEEYALNLSNSYILSACFSQNQNTILIGDNRDNMFQINRESKVQTKSAKGFSTMVHPLSVSVDAKTKLVLENYKSTYLLNESENDTLNIVFEKPYNVSFSPDGKTIAIASTKLFASIFDLQTGKELHQLVPNPDNKCDGCNPKITYSHDGKMLVMSDKYNGISFWNASSGKLLYTFNESETRYERISFSMDDKLLLCANDDFCEIINISTKKPVFTLKTKLFSNFHPVFSPNGKNILAPGEMNTILSYSIQTGKLIKKYKGFFNEKSSDNIKYQYEKWTDAAILNLLKHKAPFSISKEGNLLAQGKIDTSVVITDLISGKTLYALKGHKQQVFATCISPNSQELATGDASGTIIRWDLRTGKIISTLKAHFDVVFDLAYNEKGTELISSSWDATIKHWNLEDNKIIGIIDTDNSSAYKIGFSNRDLYILACGLDQKVHFYETDSKQLIRSLTGHTGTISDYQSINNGQQIASVSWDGSMRIWDFNSAMLTDKLKLPSGVAILSLAVSTDQSKIYCGSLDRKIYVYDLKERKITHSFEAHQSGVCNLQIHPNGKQLLSKSIEGEIKTWEIDGFEEVMTLLQISMNDWLITEPNGHFDGTSNAMKQINYVSGLKALEVGSFFKQYYYPGLYQSITNGKRFIENEQGINGIEDEVPSFDIQFTNFQNKSIVALEDSIYQHQSSTLSAEIVLKQSKNIEKISVFNNGKLIQEEPFEEEVTFRGNANKRATSISLAPENNQLEFSLTTKNGITTPRKTINIYFDTVRGQSELFILTLGINEYENSAYNLKFAKNDAISFAKSFEKSANPLFSDIYSFTILDKDVTKENVALKIKEMQQKMGPEDVFVFYYAGHGMMYENSGSERNDFYLIMSDITNLYGDKSTLDHKGVSAYDLLDYSKTLPAQKQIFVLDACQSGAALSALAVRGFQREKAIAQLARNTGTFFLTASQDVEYANEVGQLKHGIFTYAILELLEGKAEEINSEETISIFQLKSYVENRVPELSKIHKGSAQYPTGYSFGNDFPIGIVK